MLASRETGGLRKRSGMGNVGAFAMQGSPGLRARHGVGSLEMCAAPVRPSGLLLLGLFDVWASEVFISDIRLVQVLVLSCRGV